MLRVLRQLLFVLIAFAVVGGTTTQFARAADRVAPTTTADMPCDMMMPAASVDHGKPMAPCKAMMTGCAEMLGCGLNASLQVRVATATPVAWASVAYWSVPGSLEGLFVKPDLGPPITI
jgi:hypothetical protein